MELIHTEHRGKVTVAKLDRGITNAIDLSLVNELADFLARVRDDPETHSLVLTSTNDKFFSIGFDIPQLYELSRDDFALFFGAFNQVCLELYTLPKPTIAAITGHATAGGCILALCCDYRFIAQGRKLMGLNEIKLGVPLPYPADCILRELAGARIAREITYSGDFYEADRLLKMGLVDEVLPLEQVLARSIEKAEQLGSFSQQAFVLIKRDRVEGVKAQVQKYLEEREREFIDRWYSDEVRERLKKAMEKF